MGFARVNTVRFRAACGLLLLAGWTWSTPQMTFAQAEPAPRTDSRELVDRLSERRSESEIELDTIRSSITVSQEKIASLQSEIDKLAGDTASLKQALVDSADRRRALEEQIGESEARIAELSGEETVLKVSLNEERDVLADVLAALQRMGRDPPPALLVAPGDALDSVRSAILLDGVVPEMRARMESVLGDLRSLQAVKQERENARDALAADLDSLAEETRRMDMLIAENEKASAESAEALAEERRQAEAGRIADAQLAAKPRIKSQGDIGRRHPRHMLGQIDREAPDQPNSQHFRLEGTGEFRPAGPVHAVGGAELARAVDRCGTHQIANLVYHRLVRLSAGCKRLDNMPEQSHRLIGSRKHHLRVRHSSCFLFRNIGGQAFDLRGIHLAITQREGCVPCLGDHPVGAQAVVKLMCKGNESVAVLWAADTIGGDSGPAFVNIEDWTVEKPALFLQAAKKHPHEAQPARVECAEPRKPHYLPRVAKRGFGNLRSVFCPINPLSHSQLRSWRRRMPANCHP